MKNILLILVLLLTVSFAFAGNNTEISTFSGINKQDVDLNITKDTTLEYSIVLNDEGENTCYVRVCWNPTPTTRECTEWQEVPCGVDLELEGKANK